MSDSRLRSHGGRGFLSGSYLLAGIGMGIALGYWASDWEIRFFPAVVAAVVVVWIAALLLFTAGAQIERGGDSPRRLGRRATISASLAVLLTAVLAGVLLAGRPTGLTSLADLERKKTQELDAGYLRDLVRTLELLVSRMESRAGLFSEESPRVPTEEEEAFLLDAWESYLDTAMALDEIRRFHEDFYRFDLSRMERSHHVKSFLLSLVSELALFESAARVAALFEANENARRFLNAERPERGLTRDSVARVLEELAGLTDLGRVSAGRRYLRYLERVHQAKAEMAAESLSWLWDEAERYSTLAERRRAHEAVTLSAGSDFAPVLRRLKHVTFPIQRGVAEWMGDTRVKRAGGHYLVSLEQARVMEEQLEPGDVLLSRKNWYLSNVGLPGFWPHAILYVGSNESLASRFDADPDVLAWVARVSGAPLSFTGFMERSYPVAWRRRAITSKEGQPLTVIEAVSEGVIQNSLHGASGDFIAAVRPRLSPLAKAEAVFRAFAFLELPYDFDFDFATDRALVCTEVVWRAYRQGEERAGLGLDPVRVAGRLTLPANEIARAFRDQEAIPGRRLDFIYYLEGREREERAVVADAAAFAATVERSKWDFGN